MIVVILGWLGSGNDGFISEVWLSLIKIQKPPSPSEMKAGTHARDSMFEVHDKTSTSTVWQILEMCSGIMSLSSEREPEETVCNWQLVWVSCAEVNMFTPLWNEFPFVAYVDWQGTSNTFELEMYLTKSKFSGVFRTWTQLITHSQAWDHFAWFVTHTRDTPLFQELRLNHHTYSRSAALSSLDLCGSHKRHPIVSELKCELTPQTQSADQHHLFVTHRSQWW